MAEDKTKSKVNPAPAPANSGITANDLNAAEKDLKGALRSKFQGSGSGIKINFGSGSKSSSGSSGSRVSSMGIYWILIIIAFFGFAVKTFLKFDAASSLVVSIILILFFMISMWNTPKRRVKLGIIGIGIAIELIVFLGLFQAIDNAFLSGGTILGLHVYIWILVSLLLFLLGIGDEGVKLTKWDWVLVVSIFVIIIIILLSFFSDSLSGLQAPVGYQQEAYAKYLTSSKEIAQKVVMAFSETKSTIGDYAGCLAQTTASPGKVSTDECLKGKRAERYCAAQYPEKGDEADREDCLREKVQGEKVASTKSSGRKPVEVKAEMDSTSEFLDIGADLEFPLIISHENPFSTKIGVDVTCNFTGRLENVGKKVEGVVTEGSFELTGNEGVRAVYCKSPLGQLNGSYELSFKVRLQNLITDSVLQRFFINPEDDEKEELFKIIETQLKKSPADQNLLTMRKELQAKFGAATVPSDFVQLGIGFGAPTTDSAVIKGTKGLRLVYSIKNSGKGNLVSVKSFQTDLEGLSASCASGSGIVIPASKYKEKEFTLVGCSVEGLPYDLISPTNGYESREIRATLIYDYELVSKKNIKVTK